MVRKTLFNGEGVLVTGIRKIAVGSCSEGEKLDSTPNITRKSGNYS